MIPDFRVQVQLNTSEPTAPYIIGRELNLRKLPGRQWESNPQPSKQLRPMTIKTSDAESATTAHNKSLSDIDLFPSRLNYQVPLFVTWRPEPGNHTVDAF